MCFNTQHEKAPVEILNMSPNLLFFFKYRHGMNTMSHTYRGRTFLCDTYRISGTDRSKGQTVNYSQPAKCDILRLWDIDPLIILFMHLSSCVHHRDAVKCAGTTNQCWKILFVKADTGERRRQPVFTDQLLRRTQDIRVGERRKGRGKAQNVLGGAAFQFGGEKMLGLTRNGEIERKQISHLSRNLWHSELVFNRRVALSEINTQ